MAKHYIGIDAGTGSKDIVISTSTTGLAVELVIDDTKVTGKAQAAGLLEHIEGKINAGEWPPKDT